jgi:hypothetical protein
MLMMASSHLQTQTMRRIRHNIRAVVDHLPTTIPPRILRHIPSMVNRSTTLVHHRSIGSNNNKCISNNRHRIIRRRVVPIPIGTIIIIRAKYVKSQSMMAVDWA